ncbi:Dual-action HEIGH metallo-peptidase [Chitinophaga jiangningensis]|uniref:Dual-action HEIGH metallo-peptidase n=1 Tax=Chitinophaga jiangningensis TaxID=1419482 RepID=A0A1M7LNY0_9BACT|nr:M57 family metalloprotease [Chitinophaga jiangningensis]SHM79789.1 Dual-action HEIGH metallo-peptidase [Chitinophaga jiangningensis]
MKKNLFIMLAVLFAVTIASCKKSADAPAELQSVTAVTDPAKKVYNYIIGLGFPAHTIVDQPGEYIVEGDIRFPKDMVVPNGASTEQYYTGSLVSAANVANLRLYVDASMTSMISEINSAIGQWNAVANCNVNWVVVTSGTYDVLITNYNLGNGVCGQGTFPSGGKAGNLIRINKNYIAGNSFAQRARTICHELGHNVSLRHTNWAAIGESSAIAVPGVGGTDASSLMNGGQCGSGATTLSTNDKNAIAALY